MHTEISYTVRLGDIALNSFSATSLGDAVFHNLAADHRTRLGVRWNMTRRNDLMGLYRDKTAPKGNGAIALGEICALADQLGITLTLGTSVAKLKLMYEAFRFTPTHEYSASPGYCATFYRRPPQSI